MTHRVFRHGASKAPQDHLRAFGEARVSRPQRQGHEIRHHHGVGIWRGVIETAERTDDEVLSVVSRQVITAEIVRPIMLIENCGPGLGLHDTVALARNISERQRGADHVGVVVGDRRGFGLARPIGMEQAAIFCHPCTDKMISGLRSVEPVGSVEGVARIGECSDHQPIPVGKNLVVEAGTHAAGTALEKFRAHLIETFLGGVVAQL